MKILYWTGILTGYEGADMRREQLLEQFARIVLAHPMIKVNDTYAMLRSLQFVVFEISRNENIRSLFNGILHQVGSSTSTKCDGLNLHMICWDVSQTYAISSKGIRNALHKFGKIHWLRQGTYHT